MTHWNIDSIHGKRYTIEGLADGTWCREHVGANESNRFDSREAAEAELPELARALECDVSSLRVVEVADDADYVIVETMPEQHRGSHRAAGNWGVYPHNGATRSIMSRDAAEELVANDADQYDHIVRDAESSDVGKYEVAS